MAVSDLAEFYILAPSIAGGNVERAGQLANGLVPVAPIEGYRLLGLLAHKDGDDEKAELAYKQEVAAGNKPEAWCDLAAFYERNHDLDKAVTAVKEALALDQRHGPAEVDAANVLIAAKLEPALAERALRNYLASTNQTDDAPVPRVHVILGKLLLKQGDSSAARAEFRAALALAPAYQPAQKALDGL
jgi:tetratricopeptide (TPR) repeat protein